MIFKNGQYTYIVVYNGSILLQKKYNHQVIWWLYFFKQLEIVRVITFIYETFKIIFWLFVLSIISNELPFSTIKETLCLLRFTLKLGGLCLSP